jgi:hypothetical protein
MCILDLIIPWEALLLSKSMPDTFSSPDFSSSLCFPCGLFPLWFVVWHSTVIEN